MTCRSLLIAAAGVHLFLVVCSAFRWNPPSLGTAADSATRFYMALSGADGFYGFFAPGVGPQIRIRMKVADDSGRETILSLRNGETPEANLRMAGIGRLMPNLTPDQNRQLLQSLATSAFGRCPDAERVSCIVELYGVQRPNGQVEFPSMDEYRRGLRPKWIAIDGLTFTRADDASSATDGRVAASSR